MVSGRTAELDRLIGLEVGADDYLVKPFSMRELQARVAALFRRPRSSDVSPAEAAAAEPAALRNPASTPARPAARTCSSTSAPVRSGSTARRSS